MAQLMRQPKHEGSTPETEECSSLQDGSCLTTAGILPKASPLDSKERSALRFSRSQKGRKGRWKNGRRQTDFRGDGRSGLPMKRTRESPGKPRPPESLFPSICGGCSSAAGPSSPERMTRLSGNCGGLGDCSSIILTW